MTPDDIGWGKPCPAGKITQFNAGGITLTAHEDAAPIFAAFIEDIVSRGYKVAGPIPDDWGYNCRHVAGSDSWSWHAWGLAIDLNALKNPMGPDLVTDMPPWITDVAAYYGIFWGGNFNRRKDAMHFELHLTPEEAAEMREDLAKEDDMAIDQETWNERMTKWANSADGRRAIRQAVTRRPDKAEVNPDSVKAETEDMQKKINAIHAKLFPPA